MADLSYAGVRVRVRRVRDNAILYDSGTGVENASEMILDTDMSPAAGGSYTEQYVIEAIHAEGGAGSWPGPTPVVKRQTMVALGLHR